MRERSDFVSVVRDAAQAHGDGRGFTFVDEEPGPGRRYRSADLGFAELERRARALARLLEERGLRDAPVLLLYPEGLEFPAAFLGCLFARAVAVPAPLPELDAGRAQRTLRIIEDAGITCVLTDAAHREALDAWLSGAGLTGRVRCLDTETILTGAGVDPDGWSMPRIDADTPAFLQYTSGSTSAPKGVVVTHGNLLHNGEEIKRRIRGSADTVGVGWVPHFHDMGLVGQLLEPLYLGCRYVFTSPIAFIKRPVLWLELITRYRATITVAPNFGYELCLRRVTDAQLDGLDLSSLRTVKNGAEPVRAATLERMAARFGPVGFRREAWMPCYGMAETTLLISAAPFGSGPVIRSFDAEALARGEAVPVPAPLARPAPAPPRRLDTASATPAEAADPAHADTTSPTLPDTTSPTDTNAADPGHADTVSLAHPDTVRPTHTDTVSPANADATDPTHADAASSACVDAASSADAGAADATFPEAKVRRLVSSGRPVTLDVRVVDPGTRVPLPDGRVGEIWVRGGSVARGYWRDPEATRAVFDARTADGAGPYLRTGDLGFRLDGELYVTGRIKDVIIVNGRNLYAHDIEEAARAAHPAARTSAAFSLDAPDEPAAADAGGAEQVVVVQEINPAAADGTPLEELAARTKERVARAFGLPAVSVVLAARGAVRRTTSGKIQRRLTRRDFLEGRIAALAADLAPGAAPPPARTAGAGGHIRHSAHLRIS
ncbi:hypothetical protein Arub01_16130 [Actinomadura rubrobrunea]|uniref:AMP-dependent synthetase/ligase domain-containing protein n=1 Tax=Actinomadura rubrobrunea TaxID=115335 RepID=A0A9W6PUL8_9ACTN|nr:fatty acyl-AMP ligase [Actinomadura rubrobrunea]GLW63369.1 hypothetical protein Arub01_16130 [Actinomadura rubrobrunea]